MDKQALVAQLIEKLRVSALVAEAERDAAAIEARDGATPGERVETSARDRVLAPRPRPGAARAGDPRAIETLRHSAEVARARRARRLGALVEVEDEEGRGQTLFLAPAGAGEELTGPGGDGFFTVVTPKSPIGGAVLGKREGDGASARIRGETREWTVVWVG
jgi:hypothetical protein